MPYLAWLRRTRARFLIFSYIAHRCHSCLPFDVRSSSDEVCVYLGFRRWSQDRTSHRVDSRHWSPTTTIQANTITSVRIGYLH